MPSSNFRSELHISPSEEKIELTHSVLTIGSCFSDVLGEYLNNHKFDVEVNPFGTVYNPVSIVHQLCRQDLDEQKFVQGQGRWFHHDFHSVFNAGTKEVLRSALLRQKAKVQHRLSAADWIVITLGTSYVYRLKSNRQIIANCLRVPQRYFERELLSAHTIVNAFQALYEAIENFSPDCKVLLTVSPVRHTKDGIEQNMLSKSILRVACHHLVEQYRDTYYFPSYELMMDDLRDYRFYKEDLIHPTDMAQDYIWEKFQQTYVDKETRVFISEWGKIRAALAHQPFHPESEAHQSFLRHTLERVKQFTGVDTRQEQQLLRSRLI